MCVLPTLRFRDYQLFLYIKNVYLLSGTRTAASADPDGSRTFPG